MTPYDPSADLALVTGNVKYDPANDLALITGASAPQNAASAASFVDPPSLFDRFGHGAYQYLVAGPKQRYLEVTDPAAAAQYTKQLNADEALYQQGLRNAHAAEDASAPGPAPQGIPASLAAGDTADAGASRALTSSYADFPSSAGGAAALAPTMLLPGGPILGGALQGLFGGFFTPTKTPSFGSAVGNAVLGAGLGATVGRFFQVPKVPAAPSFDADMLARQAAIRSLGIDNAPLPAVTGRPQDWYDYAELGKQSGPAKDAYVAANQGYNDVLNGVLPGMRSGPPVTPYVNAEAARQGVAAYRAESQKAVGAMYDAAKQAFGANADVPLQPVADQLGKTIEDFGTDNVPGAVIARAKEYGMLPGGNQTRVFNVTNAEQFRQFLGNNLGPYGSKQYAAVRQLQGAVDEALDGVAANAPPGASNDAVSAYQTARAAAKQRFQALSPAPIKALANATEANPSFFPSLFNNGKPGEIGSLYGLLGDNDPAAAAAMRDAMLDHLNAAATQRAGGGFSGAAFAKALDRVGPDRLSSVLSPDDLGIVNNLRTAGLALTSPPPLTGINTSNTATAVSNILQKLHPATLAGTALGGIAGHLTGLPMVPEMVGAALGAAAERRGAAAAGARMRAFINPSNADFARALGDQPFAGPSMPRGYAPRLLSLLPALSF